MLAARGEGAPPPTGSGEGRPGPGGCGAPRHAARDHPAGTQSPPPSRLHASRRSRGRTVHLRPQVIVHATRQENDHDSRHDRRQGGRRGGAPARSTSTRARAGTRQGQGGGSHPVGRRRRGGRSGRPGEHRRGHGGRLGRGPRQPRRPCPGAGRGPQRRQRRSATRREDHQQGLRRLADSPATRPAPDRDRAHRLGPRLHAAPEQRLHAELPHARPGHREGGQLRLLHRRRPHRHGRHSRRRRCRRCRRQDRTRTHRPRGEDLLAGGPRPTLLLRRGRCALPAPPTPHRLPPPQLRRTETGHDRRRAPRGRPLCEANAQALGLFAEGDSDWTTDHVTAVLGRPARTFEEFVTDYTASFS